MLVVGAPPLYRLELDNTARGKRVKQLHVRLAAVRNVQPPCAGGSLRRESAGALIIGENPLTSLLYSLLNALQHLACLLNVVFRPHPTN